MCVLRCLQIEAGSVERASYAYEAYEVQFTDTSYNVLGALEQDSNFLVID